MARYETTPLTTRLCGKNRGPCIFWAHAAQSGRARAREYPGVSLAAAALALICCAAAPAHALEPYDLSAYAEYSPDTGTIRLTPFNAAPYPEVDWSSIDADKLRLVGCDMDGGCAEVPMSARVVVDVFGDNLLELSPDGGPDVLAGAASLTLTIEEGAYRKADGGAANVPLSVPVVMPGEYPAHLLEGAAYDHRTDQLSLFFADAVDASSVDWDRIYLYGQPLIGRLGFDIVHEPALVPMPEPDLVVGSREDGRVVVFALGADARNALLSMAFPALYANTGAYRGDDGTVGHAGFGKIEMHEDAYRERFAGLVSVEYLVGEDRLHVRFIGAVDPFSVDPDRMFIGTANIADSGPEPVALIGAVDPFSVDPDRMFIGTANIADSGPEPVALIGAVDPFSVDPDRMFIGTANIADSGPEPVAPIPCSKQSVYQHIPGITVSPSEFVGVSEDGKTVILNLSESNRYRLSTMPDPQLTVHDGALRWLEGGTEFVADAAPVEITGGDFFPPNPDIPAGLLADRGYEDYGRDLLSHASLKINAKMYVYFTEPIDTSAMDLGRIHLVGCAGEDCTFIPLADQQIIDGGDGTPIGITLPLGGGAILQSETRLSLVIEGGAYSRQGDGSPNAPERTAAKLPYEFYPKMLKSAEYDPNRNELALYFTEAINPSSIHSGLISVAGEGLQDLFTLSGLEPARVAGDGTYVVFELNSQDQAKLRTAEYLAVITRTGAFERASDWMAVGSDIKNLETAGKSDPTDGIEDILLVNYDYYKREDNRVAMLTDGASTQFGARACYTTGDNTLTLYLGERIDRLSIDVSRIHIYDDSHIISMSVPEFVRVGDDGRSMLFELSPHNRYVLSFMTEPSSVLLEPGAFRSPAGVTESGVRRVPLDVSGEAAFLLDPTVPAGVLLGRAEYSLAHGTAELILHFREAIDPSSVNTDLITIVNDGCSGIALSDREIVSVGKDKKSLVFGIDVNDALALWDMRSAWVRLEQGAFATAANGAVNDAGDVPLYESLFLLPPGSTPPPPVPALRIPCLITYAVQPPSAVLSEDDYSREFIAAHTKTVMSAVQDGLNAWSKSNPDITLKMVTTGTPAVVVRWQEQNEDALGYGIHNCLHYQCEIGMVLEYRNCQGGMTVFDYDTIRNIVAHEFGHNLGLAHHHSSDHLMSGYDYLVQVPFDDLGYNMPRLPSWDTVYGNDKC